MRPPSGQTDARITPFHIRLIALALLFTLIAAVLAVQMTRLAIVDGPARLARAEARLIRLMLRRRARQTDLTRPEPTA